MSVLSSTSGTPLSFTTSTSTAVPAAATGLISGIDTAALIKGILALDQQRIDSITAHESTIQGQETAFKSVEAQVLGLQGNLSSLASPQNSIFDARTVQVSDTAAVSAAASKSAIAGQYHLTIDSLAKANEIASAGFGSSSAAVADGTLNLQIGNSSTSITVDSSNDTLQGVANAINQSGAPVIASVVNDGSGSGQAYRMVLAAKATGTANQINITSTRAPSGGGGSQLLFDVGTSATLQAAVDATISLGSGPGALHVTSASNQVDSLIPGVALSLQNADPTKEITLTVANDASGITNAIQSFISSYNSLSSFIDQQTAYDSSTGAAGPLLGNFDIINIQNKMRNIVGSSVAGANPQLSYLGALGVSTDQNGQLSLDTTKLSNILAGNTPGVSVDDVRKLFTLTGTSSNSAIQFITGTTNTRASSTPYTINITQAADQASLAGTGTLGTSIGIAAGQNTLTVTVDGKTSGTLTIPIQTYTQQGLAQALQTAINSDSTMAGRQVSVGVLNNNLTITSNSYGSASQVAATSGAFWSVLGISQGASATGHDVQGNYVVNGTSESATGSGQFLLGNIGNANTSGLQVRVNLTAAQVGAGTQTDVTVSQGIASGINSMLTGLLDPVNGRLKTIDDGYTSEIQQLDSDKTAATNAMNARQQQLQAQFAAMEQTLAQLQSASGIIAQQTASLNQTSGSTQKQ